MGNFTQEDPDEGLQKQKKSALSTIIGGVKFALSKLLVHRQTLMFCIKMISIIYRLLQFLSHHF